MIMENNNSIKRIFKSLSFKVPMIFIISFIIIYTAISIIIIFRVKKQTLDEYARFAEGITNMMKGYIDPDMLDEYKEKNYELQEYKDIKEKFESIKNNHPGVKFLYIFQFDSKGVSCIIDLETEGEITYEPGSVHKLDKPLKKYEKKLIAGEEIPIVYGEMRDGKLLTYLKPVYGDDGKCTGYLGVDFSLDGLNKRVNRFVIDVAIIMILLMFAILVIDGLVVHKMVTGPLERISKGIDSFSFDSEENHFKNIRTMEELEIKSDDEIEKLNNTIIAILKKSFYYLTHLNIAKKDIIDKDEEIDNITTEAYHDSMTGVGNKVSLKKLKEEIEKEIKNQNARFAIIMADINNLKFVNDTYGHDKGDEYIIGCCSLMKGIFKNENIFRTGGDEFVTVLMGKDYEERDEKLRALKDRFNTAYNTDGIEEWERYSASLGFAEYVEDDKSFKQVLKRADKDMYKKKTEFKKKYGSYR